ncbi:MAG: DNA polymerase IV [Candidatus Marinimicrobia bacterium]|nr:DNA polymerase IV [Candidatus Neomarinimicrobiota bacterium]
MAIIAHMDIDQFYVSVEQAKDTSLKGKPVVVGGSPTGRGVVASASYEARKYGIHSAMPMFRAFKLCPHLIRISGRFGEYSRYSNSVFSILKEYSPHVERTSIDEGYVDLTNSVERNGNHAINVAEEIKLRISRDLKLSVSIGIGTNRMMAKIASDHAKPEGILEILPGKEAGFLRPMDVGVIPGVGPKTRERLKNLGIRSIAELRGLSEKELRSRFGIHGEGLYKRARGIASDKLLLEHRRKSISKERTFRIDVQKPERLAETASRMCDDICRLMKEKGLTARSIGIKMRFENFDTITRTKTLARSSNDTLIIQNLTEQMIYSNFKKGRSVRLIGVKLFNFEPENLQIDLFPES